MEVGRALERLRTMSAANLLATMETSVRQARNNRARWEALVSVCFGNVNRDHYGRAHEMFELYPDRVQHAIALAVQSVVDEPNRCSGADE